ncbi:hypothetical protein K450DRAFT_279848 [Umbelopsis ramanniana AG]|uniref:DUF4460 domain-containing protein n=1 Tax=Umbelopsis ramanniana AG TaxID=1314678 RepID=A0AAD5EB39_UMBRA|nr:uncharacterized protein K450DRAFT_279848 [Umbelopsis ramanniana AG]KAI8580656.1 hypothetical protein K450DRAFT_279848 [Umbelopsis ramanniana AG]
MSHKAAKAVNSLLKPYIRRILLKTHPDFFTHDVKKKKINQASFQTLQNVLAPILQERFRDSENNKPDRAVKLEFYLKNSKVNSKLSRIEHTLPISSPKSALDLWTTTTSILDLCRKIGIQVMPSDIDAAEQMISSLSKQHSSPSYARKPAPSLSQIFANELYQSPLAQNVTDVSNRLPKLQLDKNELLFFQPHMNSKIKESMKSNLQQALPMLCPERWWQKVPLLCVEDEQVINGIDVSGILVFTANMSTKDMQNCIEENLDLKLKEYQEHLGAQSTPKR